MKGEIVLQVLGRQPKSWFEIFLKKISSLRITLHFRPHKPQKLARVLIIEEVVSDWPPKGSPYLINIDSAKRTGGTQHPTNFPDISGLLPLHQ